MIQYGEGTNRNITITTPSSATTHLITGLKPFTEYTFTVAGVNSVGTGSFSSASQVTRTAEDSKQFTVYININVIYTHNTYLYIRIYIHILNVHTNLHTYIHTYIHIYIHTYIHTLTKCSVCSFSSAPTGSPGVPTVNQIMSTNVTLMWTEILISERNGVIIGYLIRYGNAATVQTRDTGSNTTTFVFTGLNPFTHYAFGVAGKNSANTGPFSTDTQIIRTLEDSKDYS